MEYPRITVAIPCFNRKDYIAETIESVINQGYPNLECIVVDDNSTDGSWEIIQKYKDRLAFCAQLPGGPQKSPIYALNYGLKHSTGEIIATLTDKNPLIHKSLFTVAKVFNTFPEVEWLTGVGLIINQEGIVANVIPVRKDFYEHLLGVPWAIQHESTFWRRSLWERTGGKFDEEYPWAFDAGLWRKFFFAAKLYHLNTVLGSYRKLSTAMSTARKAEFYGYYTKARQDMHNRASTKDIAYMELYRVLRWFKPIMRNIPDKVWSKIPFLKKLSHCAIAFRDLNTEEKLIIYERNPFRTIFPW